MSNARRTTQGDYLTNWTQDNAGVELNGTANSWTYAAGVVNSERTHGKAGSTNLNQLENVYAWLMRDVSNSMVTARVRYERQDPRVADKDASTHLQTDVSAFISPSSGRWAVIPGVTMEHSSDMVQKERYTPMLEAIALLDKDGQWVGTGRYETARIPAAGGYDALTAMRLAFDLSYYVNPNARIGLDWTHDTVDQGGPKMDEVQAFVHVGY